MGTSTTAWEAFKTTVETVLERGGSVTLHEVPAERHKKTGKVRVDPAALLQAHFKLIAEEAELTQGRDLSLLAMLGAPAGSLPTGFSMYWYHLNKMLFYQWKRLDEQGLGGAFPHDDFVAERKGPVPASIEEDLARLREEGLVEFQIPEHGAHKPVPIKLTLEGRRRAAAILATADNWFGEATVEIKTEIFPMDPKKLMAKVHTEYPQFRRKYVELDAS